jgi:NADPH:quinone reductase-like Zn-dependent oxidoreductase
MPRSRAAVLDGTSQPRLEVRVFEVPKLGAGGEIVLRTVMCGVCGSDFHRYSWATRGPTILGHEILGVVEHAPPGALAADGSALAVGDLVVPELAFPATNASTVEGSGHGPQSSLITHYALVSVAWVVSLSRRCHSSQVAGLTTLSCRLARSCITLIGR